MVKLLYHQAHLPFKMVMLYNNKVVHIISVLPLRLKGKKYYNNLCVNLFYKIAAIWLSSLVRFTFDFLSFLTNCQGIKTYLRKKKIHFIMCIVQMFGYKQHFNGYHQRTQLHTSKTVPGYRISIKN